MSDQIERMAMLTVKYMKDELTPEEVLELEAWKMASPENLQRFNDRINNTELLENLVHYQDAEEQKEVMKSRIPWDHITRQPAFFSVSANRRKLAVAASILVAISLGILFWGRQPHQRPLEARELPRALAKNDIQAPTGSRTILTLSNGEQVVLDSVQNGALARQGNASVSKSNGQLIYHTALDEKPTETLYNTLATASGGQTMIVLSDGSKVWLNAASSIRFPATFSGKERRVEMTGEAYFEIAHNQSVPFLVNVRGAAIKVLGTHFNVMAYDNEVTWSATLLEGGIMVAKGNQSSLLRPGQQAQLEGVNGSDKIRVLKQVDTSQVMAWKNGEFQFDVADITSVMRQLERWYGIEVSYQGGKPAIRLSGSIGRNVNLSNVLTLLESNGVRVQVDGNKVTVLK